MRLSAMTRGRVLEKVLLLREPTRREDGLGFGREKTRTTGFTRGGAQAPCWMQAGSMHWFNPPAMGPSRDGCALGYGLACCGGPSVSRLVPQLLCVRIWHGWYWSGVCPSTCLSVPSEEGGIRDGMGWDEMPEPGWRIGAVC